MYQWSLIPLNNHAEKYYISFDTRFMDTLSREVSPPFLFCCPSQWGKNLLLQVILSFQNIDPSGRVFVQGSKQIFSF